METSSGRGREPRIGHIQALAWGFGWSLTWDQAGLLLRHLEGVIDISRHLNLTAIKDVEDGIVRHIADSLAFGLHLRECPPPASPVWLDLGSGGGFPGFSAAISAPDATVRLVESRGKKVDAVRELARSLGVANLRHHHGRLADLIRSDPTLRGGCDLVFARGVGSLADIIAEAAPALRGGTGTLLCWKSASLGGAERNAGVSAARAHDLHPLQDIAYTSFKPCVLVRYRSQTHAHAT